MNSRTPEGQTITGSGWPSKDPTRLQWDLKKGRRKRRGGGLESRHAQDEARHVRSRQRGADRNAQLGIPNQTPRKQDQQAMKGAVR